MNTRQAALLAVAALLVLLALGALAWQGFHAHGAGAERDVDFRVPAGARFDDVCDSLEAAGLLRSRWIFRLSARWTGIDRKVGAGWYSISRAASPAALLDQLRQGPNVVVKLTVPEGLWVVETASIMARTLDLDSAEVVTLCKDSSFVASLHVPGPTLEGYLFPDTYRFPKGVTAREALEAMTERFHAVFGPDEEARGRELGLTPRQVITLASIIEAEAVLDEERARISAVFHNRLRLGWKLQADPTVQYARGSRRKLYSRHLRIDSPYNTYVVPGLPPGPICSPGGASIEAALHPLEPCRDLYFVAARDGGRHIFSRSNREHRRARERVRAVTKSP